MQVFLLHFRSLSVGFSFAVLMAKDLEYLCQHFSLSKKEMGEIRVDSTLLESNIARGERCLVMSLLADRYYNHEALKNTMRKVWQPTQNVSFKDLGSKLLLVEFANVRDKLVFFERGYDLLIIIWFF